MCQAHCDVDHCVGESKTCSKLADNDAICHRSSWITGWGQKVTLKPVDTSQKSIILCLFISEKVMCLRALPDPPPPHDGVLEFTGRYPLVWIPHDKTYWHHPWLLPSWVLLPSSHHCDSIHFLHTVCLLIPSLYEICIVCQFMTYISNWAKIFPGLQWFSLVSGFPETWKGNPLAIWYNFVVPDSTELSFHEKGHRLPSFKFWLGFQLFIVSFWVAKSHGN